MDKLKDFSNLAEGNKLWPGSDMGPNDTVWERAGPDHRPWPQALTTGPADYRQFIGQKDLTKGKEISHRARLRSLIIRDLTQGKDKISHRARTRSHTGQGSWSHTGQGQDLTQGKDNISHRARLVISHRARTRSHLGQGQDLTQGKARDLT